MHVDFCFLMAINICQMYIYFSNSSLLTPTRCGDSRIVEIRNQRGLYTVVLLHCLYHSPRKSGYSLRNPSKSSDKSLLCPLAGVKLSRERKLEMVLRDAITGNTRGSD